MKYVLLFGIVLLASVKVEPVKKQHTNQPTQEHRAEGNRNPQPSPTLPIAPIPAPPNTYNDHCLPQYQTWDWHEAFTPPTWSNWFLVAVGIGAIIAASCTLRAILRQVTVMKWQGRILLRQTKATETSAEAAKISAVAAQRNIDLLISKERKRIRVRPKLLDLLHPYQGTVHTINYEVLFYGATEAYVLNSGVWVDASDSHDGEITTRVRLPIRELPDIITATEKSIECRAWAEINSDTVRLVKNGKKFIRFYGFISYRDTFEIVHTTKFRYQWRENAFYSAVPGTPIGEWYKNGPESQNEET
jgi:hypothetical protein